MGQISLRLVVCRSAAMACPRDHTALPPEASQPDDGSEGSIGRPSRERERKCYSHSRNSSCSSPSAQERCQESGTQQHHVSSHESVPFRLIWTKEKTAASSSQDASTVHNWHIVLDELAVLRCDVAALQANKKSTSLREVNFQASSSRATQLSVSHATFSCFGSSSSEDGEIREVTTRGSVLLQNAKDLGPPD